MSRNKTIWPGSTQLGPVPAVLVGCGNGKEFPWNVITVAWTGTVCSDPPMIGISIRKERFSYSLIDSLGEFTVNLPPAKLAPAVDYCGVASGRKVDKFKERNLTPHAGSEVSAPVIEECPVTLECKVTQKIPLGSHDLFLGKILAVQVDSSLIDENGKLDLGRAGLLAYLHGHYYSLGRELGYFGFSVRKKAVKEKKITHKKGLR